jgi:hydroxymethylglutaryl-CoA lyase
VSELIIRDCSPRDGLQPLTPIKPSQRAELVRRLEGAGLRHIEIASFVSPRAVPAMADAAAVLAELGPSDAYWVLVPNRRGAEMALDAGATQLTVTVSASEGYSEKNTQRSIAASLEAFSEIRATAPDAVLDVVISCCFGSPFEPIRPTDVASLVRRLAELGADLSTLADTTGTATPARLTEVLTLTGTDHGLHLHDSRGTALVNAYAGFQAGVRRFDTSLGGLGGSPFAPGAGGNLATEDLVLVMEDLGVETGIELEELLVASRWLAEELSIVMPSRVSAAGPLEGRAQ